MQRIYNVSARKRKNTANIFIMRVMQHN
jgi:hypothetical protein